MERDCERAPRDDRLGFAEEEEELLETDGLELRIAGLRLELGLGRDICGGGEAGRRTDDGGRLILDGGAAELGR